MSARSVALAVVGAVAMLAAPATARAADEAACMTQVSTPQTRTMRSSGTATVYLNANGGRVAAGYESAVNGRSQVVWSRGLRSVDVPAFSRGVGSWAEIAGCVQEQFADFDVEIVSSRPSSGPYIMAMIGGRSSMLGFSGVVGGIAPYNGQVIDDAVVFVFEQNLHGERSVCEATAHEIGHVLGLDHSTLCSDTMSYGSCGPKQFQDRAAACGEFGQRGCGTGEARQNSHARLAALVGGRSTTAPEPSVSTRRPESPVRPRPRPPAGPTGNDGRPQISVLSADRLARRNSTYEVTFKARDADGIADVELLWSDGRKGVRLRCGRSARHWPATCSRRGDTYTFALEVGQGARVFAIRVTDGAGNMATTKPRYARFR